MVQDEGYIVIDGQQRITTTMLLLISLRSAITITAITITITITTYNYPDGAGRSCCSCGPAAPSCRRSVTSCWRSWPPVSTCSTEARSPEILYSYIDTASFHTPYWNDLLRHDYKFLFEKGVCLYLKLGRKQIKIFAAHVPIYAL